MSKTHFLLCASIAVLTGARAVAETPPSAEIAELRRQLEALTSKVNDLQQQLNHRRLDPIFSEPAHHPGKASEPAPAEHSPRGLRHDHGEVFKPNVSVAIDTVASYSRRADNVNFIARDAEVMIEGEIDGLARAYAIFNAETELTPLEKTDVFDEISPGVEEAAIETTALPWGLQVKGGQFFADVGRLARVHSHELPFTDRPLSLDRIVGGESKARGLEVSWSPPSVRFLRLTGGVTDNVGSEATITSRLARLDGEEGDAFRDSDQRRFSDLSSHGRATARFALSPRSEMQLGGSYARGREAGRRELAGADFLLSWKPQAGADDLLEVSGEYLWGKSSGAFGDDARFESGPAGGTARAHGGYVYAQYRLGPHWQPGLRFDYLRSESWEQTDADRDGEPDAVARGADTIRTWSAYLNYHLSDCNRLRLQVNYAQADRAIFAGADDDWQAFFQWSVILGPHHH